MKKTRILFVSPVGFLGGAEQVFLSLCELLPTNEFEPVLVCLRPGPLVKIAADRGVTVYVFNKDFKYRQLLTVFKAIFWLRRLAKDLGVDLIHSNHTAHLISSFVKTTLKLPEVWHMHDFPYEEDALTRFIKRLPASYIIYTTNKVASGYPELHKIPHKIIHPTCIDPLRLQSFTVQSSIRERFNLPPGPIILTVARIQNHKGVEYLIKSAPDVLKVNPNALFLVAGKATGSEQEIYRDKLLELIKSTKLENSVKLLGYVEEEDLVSLYREATCLVHPALSEGFGLTLLEAMSLDLPVIVTDADGPKEIVDHNINGLVVPVRDSIALSLEINRMLGDEELRLLLKDGGEKYIEDNDVHSMIASTISVYKELVASIAER